ncbi:hypothetical protein EON65_16970 [archaeon]|nr:MAG: hypothetical protein EON65_16970 [archaeon]
MVCRGDEEAAAAAAAKPTLKNKNWNKIDYNDLDKQWESGDDQEELEHDFEHIRKIQEKKRPKLNMEDGHAIRNAYQQDPFLFSGGGMMVFVDLKPKQPDGKEWDKRSTELLSKRYSTLLRSGGVVGTVYNIDEKRLLINVDKSWQTKDMLTFLAKQAEVESFTANSKTYSPKEYLASIGEDSDDDEDL